MFFDSSNESLAFENFTYAIHNFLHFQSTCNS